MSLPIEPRDPDPDNVTDARPGRIGISSEAFDRLLEELDRPPRVIPKLAEAMRRRRFIRHCPKP